MNIKEKKEQIKNWVKENKLNIGLGVAGIATVVILTINAMKPDTKEDVEREFYEGSKEEFDNERDILLTFSDELTGEVLWKERCGDDFLNDSKKSGMQYAEVRQLNGLEEA